MRARNLLVLIGSFLVLLGSAGVATAADDGFARSGWYLGAGVAAQYYLLTDTVESDTDGALTVSNTVGFNVRGGYRLFSWLAAELIYERAPGFELETDKQITLTGAPGSPTVPKGTTLIEINGNTVTANAKILLPMWRVQPYLILGIGASRVGLADRFDLGVDESETATAGRMGVGGDIYITKNLLVFLEFSALLTSFDLNDPTDSSSISLLYYLSPQGGLQWRF
jgi:opacity protein-like surface antigen